MTAVGRLLLGSGRFDEPLRTELLAASPVVFEEGLSGSSVLTERREYTHNPTRGAIAVTGSRLVVLARRHKTIDVPLSRRWFAGLVVAQRRPDLVSFTVDLGHYGSGDTGSSLEIRLRTDAAPRIVGLLAGLGRTG